MMKGGGGWVGMAAARWRRLALALLAVWLVVSYLVMSPLRCEHDAATAPDDLQQRMRDLQRQLHAVRAQHNALRAQIKRSRLSGSNLAALDGPQWEEGPSEEYETLRRRIHEHTKELWYYASHEIARAIAEPTRIDTLQNLLSGLDHRKSVLLANQQQLWSADGQAEWREREAARVSALVQRRLRALQHPPDCGAARILVCNLNKGCGFGCQLHHIAYCLIVAYATERTLVLNSAGWRYNAKGWDRVFLPLSDSCTAYRDDHVKQWPATEARVVSLPFIDSISQRPRFLPLAIPKDLAHSIVRFNGDPASWWVGQMLKYILRPRAAVQKQVNDTIAKIDYRSPIVGVHIRRTDKVGTEAAFHHIHEYMRHVEQYWQTRDLARAPGEPPAPRRVYLASDDPAVLEDARGKYPHVQFVGDAAIARTAATHRRYTPASLAGLLVDLTLLARADYLVCTFSSQVGRVAYELMQGNRADASDAVFSLDDIYYFGGQNAHDRRAVLPHTAQDANEISFQEGDLIGIAGNHWNGYGRGTNRRTNMNGLIPWYKTVDHLVLYPFPEYKHVPLHDNTHTHPPPAQTPDNH